MMMMVEKTNKSCQGTFASTHQSPFLMKTKERWVLKQASWRIFDPPLYALHPG